MKNFFKYHFWFIAWALVIFIQSSYPAIEVPQIEVISTDKLLHMGVFGLLAMLCYISIIHLEKENIFTDKPLIWSLIICALYGASDEIHQYFVPNRSAEYLDWAADIIGIIIAVIIINYYFKNKYVLFQRRIIK